MSVEMFEDLIAWQKARELTREVYRLTRRDPVVRDFRFAGQFQSAAVSTMSNIAEGFEWNAPRQFMKYLRVATSSCAEVRSLLYVALHNGYIDDGEFRRIMASACEVARVIVGLHASQTRRSSDGRKSGPP